VEHVAAIIPTRAGSTGLPDKCMMPVAGSTLIAHAVRQAVRVLRTRAFVITDSLEHAAEAEAAGGWPVLVDYQVPDDAVPEQQERRAMDMFPELFAGFRSVCRLFVTHPLRSDWDILRAVELHQNTGETVITTTEADFREHQVVRPVDTSGRWGPADSNPARPRQQVSPPEHYLVGCAYVARLKSYRRHAFWPPEGFVPSHVPLIRSLDIDTPSDLALVRKLWPIRHDLEAVT